MKKFYDAVIVGGGPSGAVCAKYLDGRKNVLILERSPERNSFKTEKSCGGLLAPDAQAAVASLGLGIPLSILAGPQLFNVKTVDFDNNLTRNYQRHYINIKRGAFDAWLRSLSDKTCDFSYNSRFTSFSREGGDIRVHYVKSGRKHSVMCRYLAGADGANSSVRRLAYPSSAAPRLYISIQEWYRIKNSPPFYEAFFDSAVTDFYSWTIPKDDYLIVGSAIPVKTDVHKRFDLFRERISSGLTVRLKKPEFTRGAFIYRPASAFCSETGRGNIFLTGEAAGFISPSSAEGISYALLSGRMLARAILSEGDTAKEYRSQCGSLLKNITGKLIKSPFMYNRFLRGAVMFSGVKSMDILE
jgi:flavin-dependent dehydrogenase